MVGEPLQLGHQGPPDPPAPGRRMHPHPQNLGAAARAAEAAGAAMLVSRTRRAADVTDAAIESTLEIGWSDDGRKALLLINDQPHAAFDFVRGIRQKPVAAASPADARRGAPGSMDDPRWRRGYALLERHGFSYDLQTPWWHLDAAAALAADFPRTTIIINHTGLPADRSAEGLAAWRAALERVAAHGNVTIKISGLGQRGLPWTVEANAPIIRDTIAIFGAERCMFASNYPVDSLCAPFDTIYRTFADAVVALSEHDQRAVLADNARRVYRIDAAPAV